MSFKSCRFIEHGIYFKYMPDGSLAIKPCCNMDAASEDEQLFLQKKYTGGKFDWQEILKIKRQHRDDCRKGNYNCVCAKCWELKEGDWDEDDYFSEITFAHIIKCNSRCVYCYIGCDEKLYSAKQEYKMMPVIQDLQENNLLRFTGSLRYMGGEPTLMSDFEEITDLFVENNIPEIYLPTSGIKFSKAMEKACKTVPFCQIFISIDSGSPETYKKIKGIDAYNIVLESLRKYASNREIKGHILSKYILVPKINDNTTEIDKWISESKKIGLRNLAPDAEYSCVFDQSNEKYLKHLLNLTKYMEKKIYSEDMIMDNSVVYRKILLDWAEKNKKRLMNDTPNSSVELNISNMSKDVVADFLNKIIDENSIWNKPLIQLTSDKEITETEDFEEILYTCFLLGFDIHLQTNGENFSEMIKEALKISNIKLFVNENGKFVQDYKNIDENKVFMIN